MVCLCTAAAAVQAEPLSDEDLKLMLAQSTVSPQACSLARHVLDSAL